MIILKYLDMQYIFVAKNLCYVLPLEATTLSLFFDGNHAAIQWFAVGRCSSRNV